MASLMTTEREARLRASHGPACTDDSELRIVMSFDVEEHHRIEAASGLPCDDGRKSHYAGRMARTTFWLLEQLDRLGIEATFFFVGEIARTDPGLVRAAHRAGHEIASHGWDHRRVHVMGPDEFRDDIRRSKEALEAITGEAVVGYRAPTFSITRQTAWAIDVLVELGMRYDSSIFPVRHDRYGVPDAPRAPFIAHGRELSILELPPATLRLGSQNLPVGGGGYFRLFPLPVLEHALLQLERTCSPPAATLYFQVHPEVARAAQVVCGFNPRSIPLTLDAFRGSQGS
jgi:polysaccharide deacetylase family protein (PEP-CTERM system associated)